jgi:beta-glucosidase
MRSLALAVLVLVGQQGERFRLATTPSSRSTEGWWMERHEKLVERVGQGHVGMLMIGDSIVQGWEGEGREAWERHYKPRGAVNLGVGSDRTQHVLWRLDHGELEGIRPAVAVVLIGTNNLGSDTNDDIVAGVEAVVKLVRSKLPETRVLLLGLFPREARRDDPRRARIRAINARLARLDDHKSIRFLDLGPTFLNPDGSINESLLPDFLHPGSSGYRAWAEAMEPTLWDMMEGKSSPQKTQRGQRGEKSNNSNVKFYHFFLCVLCGKFFHHIAPSSANGWAGPSRLGRGMAARRAEASRRSAVVVILRLEGEPATTRQGWPIASTSWASSVTEPEGPSRPRFA